MKEALNLWQSVEVALLFLLQFQEQAGISWPDKFNKKISCFLFEISSHLDVFLPLHILPNIVLYSLSILEHTSPTTRLLCPDA